jgi:hypothetical protein
MHPFHSLYTAELRQAELLRRAEAGARFTPRLSLTPVRATLGYWLVELGLRLIVQPRRLACSTKPRPTGNLS